MTVCHLPGRLALLVMLLLSTTDILMARSHPFSWQINFCGPFSQAWYLVEPPAVHVTVSTPAAILALRQGLLPKHTTFMAYASLESIVAITLQAPIP